jgi:phosphatidylinositol-3,4,5-trisphosphate 3-phosphatase/dual-specificity protein phosphatase PTEN
LLYILGGTLLLHSILRGRSAIAGSMFNWVRVKVSRKKQRFQEGHYDLDLAYITDRIIAMGYPAQGFESCYRNDYPVVRRFLDERHSDHYMVYNLCSESDRQYDAALFDSRVQTFGFEDHNPPVFDSIRQFCLHAAAWLVADTENVIAVHCKAGKGRTGLMICALLLHMDQQPNVEAALAVYGRTRTHNGKGVTIPSQRRYIFYYERFLRSELPQQCEMVPRPCTLTKVAFDGLPNAFFSRSVTLEISTFERVVAEIKAPEKRRETMTLEFSGFAVEITGDFKIAPMKGKNEFCFAWFNSEYVDDETVLTRQEIDQAHKAKTFSDQFKMKVWVNH